MHSYIIRDAEIWTIQHLVTSSTIWECFLQLRDQLIQLMGMHHAKLLPANGPPPVRLRMIYQVFRGTTPKLYWTKALLDPVIMPRHKVIVLLAMQNSLSTTDNLCKQGFHMVSRCVLCFKAEETSQHLFFACEYSSCVLRLSVLGKGLQDVI
ncbi:uncharacterized protein LOC141588534 [Silene latifolia]|uniref:uncharacterized protein LOC141588534 n=1 Tax=Silene latifolia TaxID=37657 RepID=UPI003D7859B2